MFLKRPKTSNYYIKHASKLGWGESNVLDKERLKLLDKFLIGKKVLDVGCGMGLYVDYLAKNGIDAYGMDFVEEFISFAQKSKKGTYLMGKAEKLPFANLQFDTVILFNILEHGDDIKILKEAKRVTKKRILAIVPRIVDETLEKSGIIFRHYLDKSHQKEYKEKDFKYLARLANLKLTHLEEVHALYNETIFLALFGGSIFFKKVIRKLSFLLLPKKNYPTEIFAVFEKR